MKKQFILLLVLALAYVATPVQAQKVITTQEREQIVRYLINRMRPLPLPTTSNANPKYLYYYTPTPVTMNEWLAVLEKTTLGATNEGNRPAIISKPGNLTGLLIHELRMPFFLSNKQNIDAACKNGDFSKILKAINPGKNEPFYLITTYEGWKQFTKNK